MNDRDLYQQILGIQSPWFVESVKLNMEEQRIDVKVKHPPHTLWSCPKCDCMLPIYDHAEDRSWRHLNTCQLQTHLHAAIPRVSCQEHGVLQVDVAWSRPHSRFTLLFECLAIDILQQCSLSSACSILGISWDVAWGIKKRAVDRGLKAKKEEPILYAGIDEKSVKKGHKYFTLVYNLLKSRVEFVTEDRSSESIDRFYRQMSVGCRDQIQAVAMDMWEPFISVTEKWLGNDKVVIDRFHIMKHLNQAVDSVRKQELRSLEKRGDHSLKGSKYVWLYNRGNLPKSKEASFEELMKKELEVGKAYAFKEVFREFWHQTSLKKGIIFLLDWWLKVTESGVNPMKKASRTVMNHFKGILNYFNHRITNAVSEGINSKIQSVKKMAYGYRNLENFKTAIYFHCGGLDLYP